MISPHCSTVLNDDLMVWLVLNLFSCDNKTELMIFGGTTRNAKIDLCSSCTLIEVSRWMLI